MFFAIILLLNYFYPNSHTTKNKLFSKQFDLNVTELYSENTKGDKLKIMTTKKLSIPTNLYL